MNKPSNNDNSEIEDFTNYHRTDVCTHANAVLLGRYYHVVNDTGRIAEFKLFSTDYKTLHKIPAVDVVTQYDNKYSVETCTLFFNNVLYVLAIDHNILTPLLVKGRSPDRQPYQLTS